MVPPLWPALRVPPRGAVKRASRARREPARDRSDGVVREGERDEALTGSVDVLEDDVCELELAELRMAEPLASGRQGRDLVSGPPGARFCAPVAQARRELLERRIAPVPGVRDAEPTEERLRL